ncbi:MAG: pyridoxamine 5'-phosphate oxidase family protein [Egibacteraceae bacterium]
MGEQYERLTGRLEEFLLTQPVFFVGTAPNGPDGHVNVSPKGLIGTFAVLDERTVAYLDFTGSGVETIAHLRENGRIVLMFCAFQGPPKIVRLHGRGEVVLPEDSRFRMLRAHFRPACDLGVRAIIVVSLTRISDSCGYAVPLLRYEGDRDLLDRWSAKPRSGGLATYRAQHNATSIDGLPGL